MISNYTPNFSMEGKYGVLNSTGKIQKGANGSTLNAFTAYFTYTGAANVKAVVSYLDNEGELTKIEGVDFDDSTENETIYDLQGRKVEKPGKSSSSNSESDKAYKESNNAIKSSYNSGCSSSAVKLISGV